jgi:protein FrlC
MSARLAYSSNAYTRTTLADALRRIADLGYAGAEVLCDRPHWFPGEVTPDEADAIARLLAKTGLAVSNLNANTANGYWDPAPPENVFEPALSNPDPVLRRWRQDYSIAALELAARIGAPCISVTSGRPCNACEPERAVDHFVASLERVCTVAEDLGVRVGIEYEPGLLVERAAEVLAVIDRVASPALGVNFDIGHSHLMGEDPAATVAALAGRIWNVHAEDIRGGKHFHRVPGDGDLPLTEYLCALRRHGYAGFVTVELYSFPDRPDAVGRAALDYLAPRLEAPCP